MKVASGIIAVLILTGLGVWGVLRTAPQPGSVIPEGPAPRRTLRVCADPNNLPFSNEKREGFENRIAELLGRELGLDVEYVWWAQRRGFVRNTIGAGDCDLVVGIPSGFDRLLVTSPYYRSTYVFVYRKDAGYRIDSLDAPVLRRVRIGVQVIGDDGANSPPAHALARRGIIRNVRGYTVYGDYSRPNPPAAIIDAVVRGEIDVAVAWGPMAGFFARQQEVPLELQPVSPQVDVPFLPFVFDISAGVRRGEESFRNELDRALERRRADIERILDAYGVPRVS